MVHTVGTGIAVTFAVLLLTVGTREAAGAAAGVAARDVLLARAAVETRIVRTGHCTGFTVLPVEALRARARVVVHQVLEWTRDGRRVRTTRRNPGELKLQLAGRKARGGASGAVTHLTAAAVPARVAVALVGLQLAVDAGEAGLARAGVAALPGVGARGVVLARLVIGAVVQVCDGNNNAQRKRRTEKIYVQWTGSGLQNETET